MSLDPVCKMQVNEKSASATSQHMGKTYYFCCQGCKNAFDKDPYKYLDAGAEPGDQGHHGHG